MPPRLLALLAVPEYAVALILPFAAVLALNNKVVAFADRFAATVVPMFSKAEVLPAILTFALNELVFVHVYAAAVLVEPAEVLLST